MKFLFSLFVILLSLNSFSHCGSCGEGEAEDHQEKGEDSSHHNEDNSSEQAQPNQETSAEDESDNDGDY
jgi:hypothetical protein